MPWPGMPSGCCSSQKPEQDTNTLHHHSRVRIPQRMKSHFCRNTCCLQLGLDALEGRLSNCMSLTATQPNSPVHKPWLVCTATLAQLTQLHTLQTMHALHALHSLLPLVAGLVHSP